MEQNKDTSQRGQSLVLVALMIVALVGMLALVIDGGYGYAKRRAAQVAADAGALAGANVLCTTGVITDSITAAFDYAINRNEALEADVNVAGGYVTVTTRIPFQTFFAGVIGQPQVTAAATAVAGCFCPGVGEGVLPIAWACRPPVSGEEPGTEDCVVEFGNLDDPVDPDNIYIIMDSQSVDDDFVCQDPPNSGDPSWALDCDLNDDDIDDLLAEGNRSWLDLNGGGGGASEMSDWIDNGFPGDVFIHTWYGGQAGTDNSVFQTTEHRVGDVVLIPVFDRFCEGVPNIVCPDQYHTEDLCEDPAWTLGGDCIVPGGGASQLYYHVISFSAFVITCVDAPGARPPEPCAGRTIAESVNPDLNWNPIKTIEGYFIEGYAPGLGGRPGTCVDVGAYTIYLLR